MRRLQCIMICFILAIVLLSFCPAAFADSLLKPGMAGEEVRQLQIRLKELGYFQDDIDSLFGANTRLAVIELQVDCGLEPDGIVGLKTKQALLDMKISTANRGLTDSRKAAEVVALAKRFIGIPYVWGGGSPGGFDCSGYTYYLYSKMGVHLPRMADGQFEAGVWVKRSELQPGDLVFFSTYEPGPSHCGIYIGDGFFIHASSGAGEVTVTPMSKPYYQARYLGARRVLR